HPLTFERVADAQNRAAALPYKQHPDSPEFQLVRAKLRSERGDARDAVAYFDAIVREGRYASEAAARYGLASSLLRANRARDADAEVARLRKTGVEGPMIETLAARVKQGLGEQERAAAMLGDARKRYPHSRALLYAHVNALHEGGRDKDALAALTEPMRIYPKDAVLYQMQA